MSSSAPKSVAGFAALLLLVSLSLSPPGVKAATHSQIRELSERLVNQALKPKAGDIVEVTSSAQNLELLEDLWLDLHKVGAWPIIRIHTDRMDRLYYQEVPAKFDAEPPLHLFGLARIMSAQINVDYESDPAIFANASRITNINNSGTPVTKYMLVHNEPFIEVGNGLYPSKYTAQQYGISVQQLADLFWSGVNAEPGVIRGHGQTIQRALGSGALVRITAPNGTDVTFKAAASSVVINDGTISAAARKKGGAALNISLPAGDVTFIPEPGSAKGTVISAPLYYGPAKVVGLTFHLAAGKMTSFSASLGRDVVNKFYKAGGPGRDEFSFADIGANPNIRYIAGSALAASMAGGMVSFSLGGNLSNGGSNLSAFTSGGYIPNATVTIGDKTIVKNGALTQ